MRVVKVRYYVNVEGINNKMGSTEEDEAREWYVLEGSN
jgi:hypothetical protein